MKNAALKFELGSLSSEAILSFEEPWLFQQELALGFNIYRQSSDYYSAYYQEIRTGAEVYLRKHLFEYVESKLSLTDEEIQINDISPSASPLIQSLGGKTRTVKIGFELLRDVRDKLVNSTRGNRIQVDANTGGRHLGGSNDYYSIEAQGRSLSLCFAPRPRCSP